MHCGFIFMSIGRSRKKIVLLVDVSSKLFSDKNVI